jgi:enoyl-CoA hydratase/carnithine racemase/3-hydroxyacyl-CoA dehydrogenase
MSVSMHIEDGVGYVLIDNPPVNAIGQSVRQGLLDAVRWAETQPITRVILSGAGRAFAAGADTREFDQPPVAPHLPDVLNAIDASFVPWIAAINGVAFGGGAEIAMACRMRIIAPTAQIGLPEVTLGVIPGAGGTQRLPRLVGLAKALDMITTGVPLDADAALSAGLVHAIEDDPVVEAFMVNTEELGCIVPTWELPAPEHDTAMLTAARQSVTAHKPQQNAPQRTIDVIEAGLSIPFHDALPIERAAFVQLKTEPQAKALRHIFFAERASKREGAIPNGDQISARLHARYLEAADTVFMDGSTPWEVDEAMVEFGYAMGPYETQDVTGLDIDHGKRRAADASRDPNRRYILIADRMMELGKLGRKTGAGWYRYPGGNGKVEDPIVADLAIEESHFAKRTRTDYAPDDIRERLLLALINEAADLLDEGIARSARDIDVICVADNSFPRWRGGVMHYADTLGAQKIVQKLEALAKEDPVVWNISPVLNTCAAQGLSLAQFKNGAPD